MLDKSRGGCGPTVIGRLYVRGGLGMTRALTVFCVVIATLAAVLPATLARADCPAGGRALKDSEQQAYVALQQAIKAAIPPPPPGWTLRDLSAKFPVSAPQDVCEGDPSPGWSGAYISEAQMKLNVARSREHQAEVREVAKYTPEEQKELDDAIRQISERDQKARALAPNNPEEAARIRAEARPFQEQAITVRRAHQQRVVPALQALSKQYSAEFVDPGVAVNVVVTDDKKQLEAKEPLQIPGAASAFLANPKKIVLSLGQVAPASASGGIGTNPRTLWVEVTGDRALAEPIANLLASSNLRTVAKN
jgi:hypothetical protein